MNEIWLDVVGVVATEPTYGLTDAGVPLFRFRLASTPTSYADGQWVDKPTNFITVRAWRHIATNAASSISKGQPVLVHGRLTVREYTGSDGRTAHETVLDANALGHNLARGTSAFLRAARSGELGPGRTDSAAREISEPDDLESAGLGGEFGRPVEAPAAEASPEADAA